jgi:hypothetical protein
MLTGEQKSIDNKLWRTPYSSWLDLEEKYNCQRYHVNIIMHKSNISKDCMLSTAASSETDSSRSPSNSSNTDMCEECQTPVWLPEVTV